MVLVRKIKVDFIHLTNSLHWRENSRPIKFFYREIWPPHAPPREWTGLEQREEWPEEQVADS